MRVSGPHGGAILGFDNPEFGELVRAYRGYGEVVSSDAEFGPAFAGALEFANSKKLPALLELRYDADGNAPGMTLPQIREEAFVRQSANR